MYVHVAPDIASFDGPVIIMGRHGLFEIICTRLRPDFLMIGAPNTCSYRASAIAATVCSKPESPLLVNLSQSVSQSVMNHATPNSVRI